MTDKLIPSPFYLSKKDEALKFLEDMRLPEPREKSHDCSRDCHIMERNYVLDVVREKLQELL